MRSANSGYCESRYSSLYPSHRARMVGFNPVARGITTSKSPFEAHDANGLSLRPGVLNDSSPEIVITRIGAFLDEKPSIHEAIDQGRPPTGVPFEPCNSLRATGCGGSQGGPGT